VLTPLGGTPVVTPQLGVLNAPALSHRGKGNQSSRVAPILGNSIVPNTVQVSAPLSGAPGIPCNATHIVPPAPIPCPPFSTIRPLLLLKGGQSHDTMKQLTALEVPKRWHNWTLVEKQTYFHLYARKIFTEWCLKPTTEAAQTVCDKYSAHYRFKTTLNADSHSEAKISRQIVELLALVQMVDYIFDHSLFPTRIVDYFGSDRVKNYTKALIDHFDGAVNFVLPITFVHYTPMITAKDYVANSPSAPYIPLPTDLILLVDIYMASRSELLDVITSLPAEHFFLCTMIFNSSAVVGTKFGNMPYYLEGGLVKQSPSFRESFWPPTEPNSKWLEDSYVYHNNQHLVWTVSRKIESYNLIQLRKTNVRPQVVTLGDPLAFIDGDFITIKTIEPDTSTIRGAFHKLSSVFYSFCGLKNFSVFSRPLYVCIPALNHFAGRMCLKTRQSYQISTLTTEVQGFLMKNEYQSIWTMSNISLETVLQDTVAYLTWGTIDKEKTLWSSLVHQFGSAALELKTIKSKLVSNPPENPWLRFVIAVVLCAFFGKWFLKNFLSFLNPLRFNFFIFIKKIFTQLNFFGSSFYDLIPSSTEPVIQTVIPLSTPSTSVTINKSLTSYISPYISSCWTVIAPTFCLGVVPFFEEQLKSVTNYGTILLALFESYPFFQQISLFWSSFLFKFALHSWFANTTHPFLTHLKWNTCVLFGSTFIGEFSALQFFVMLMFTVLIEKQYNRKIPPATFEPELFTPGLLKAPQHPQFNVPSDFYDQQATDGFYSLLLPPPTESGKKTLFYRPVGIHQFFHAYMSRNMKETLITNSCEQPWYPEKFPKPLPACVMFEVFACPVHLEWLKLRQWLTFFHSSDREIVPLRRNEWAQNMGSAMKKHRALDSIQKLIEGDVQLKTEIFLKSDEVLFYRENGNKGRTVKSVAPIVQAMASKFVHSAIISLKDSLKNKMFRVGKWRIAIAIGSGMTSAQLDEWYNLSLFQISRSVYSCSFIVAGDDFFAIVNSPIGISYIETDFSSWDRTLGVHALELNYLAEQRLGIPIPVLDQMYAANNARAKFKHRASEYTFVTNCPPQRATGSPNTTLGNCILNILAHCHAFNELQDLNSEIYENTLAKLGLIAKTRFLSEPIGTFLKGWWVLCTNGDRSWLPLPTQVCKLGKILTNPSTIYPHLPGVLAWNQAARAMALGVGSVPHSYPILGALIKRYLSLAAGDHVILMDPHKIKVTTTVEICVASALAQICERYSINESDILAMEHDIRVTQFPGQLSFSGWERFALRDYG
jgi:hypothetical protein